MNMWGIIWTVIAPLFFSGALVWLLRSWISIRLKNSIEHEYNEKLEVLKSQQQRELEKFAKILEKRNYVSKVRFDAEFQIYQLIFDVMCELMVANNALFLRLDRLPQKKEEINELYQERYKKAAEIYNKAMRAIEKSAPFVTQELYNDLKIILKKCKEQLNMYPDMYLQPHAEEFRKLTPKICGEAQAQQDSIGEDYATLIIKAREYLKSLDVK